MTPLAIYWITCGAIFVYIDQDFHGWEQNVPDATLLEKKDG
jgi:hypothetical protein